MSLYMGKQGHAVKYYNEKLKNPPMHNLLYITKDLDLLETNYDDEFIDKVIEKTQEINVDKSTDMRHKLLNLVKDNEKIDSMLKLEMWIEYHYVYVLDKEPPVNHLRGYIKYICLKVPRLTKDYMIKAYGTWGMHEVETFAKYLKYDVEYNSNLIKAE